MSTKTLETFRGRREYLGALRETVNAAPVSARRRKELNAALDAIHVALSERDSLIGGARTVVARCHALKDVAMDDLARAVRGLAALLDAKRIDGRAV